MTRCLINFIAILITGHLLDGIVVNSLIAVLAAAFVLGIVNTFIRPILVILSLPLTIITLGLFTFVINALMLLLTASLIPGFSISSFWTAFFGAIIISILSSIILAVFD